MLRIASLTVDLSVFSDVHVDGHFKNVPICTCGEINDGELDHKHFYIVMDKKY